MEVRGPVENNDVRMSSGAGGGGGRRGDGNHNGNSTFLGYAQTLDHHHRGNSSGGGSNNSASKGNSAPAVVVRYRECLRNHAASVGGNVYDGCGEFMPGGEEGSLEALKCAACECHRNFHRKEIDGETAAASPTATVFSPGSRRGGGGHLVHALQLPPALPSPVMHPHHPHHIHGSHHRYLHSASPPAVVQPMSAVAFGSGGGSGGGGGSAATGGTESSSEDLNAFPSEGIQTGMVMTTPQAPYGMSKKRFRTKFTQEQKERMMEFAEKVGWRINKQDEEAVERFCSEVGVRRQVFKVWMHNNKNVKKQTTPPPPTNNNLMSMHHQHHHHHHHQGDEEVQQQQQQQQHHHQEGML